MLIKGFINAIHIEREMTDIFTLGSPYANQIPGKTTARAEIIFIEGPIDDLITNMQKGERIELDISPAAKNDLQKPMWRMIRVE